MNLAVLLHLHNPLKSLSTKLVNHPYPRKDSNLHEVALIYACKSPIENDFNVIGRNLISALFSLVGKVNVVVDKLRVDRSRVRLAEVEVGDETGTVSLRARDEQIDVLEEVSQKSGAVVLRNCMLELFQGRHIRLAVTKWGKMSVFPDDVASTPPAPSKINKERNFSLIDLSVVASEMVENQPPEVGYIGSNRESPTDRNRGSQNRQPFQPPQYQTQPQPQLLQRRTTRDRRQLRPGRGVGAKTIPIPFPEMSMQSQMRYPGVPGYGYGESLELQHYAFGAPRPNQEGMHPTPHQFMQLQQQQYEMQRMQQMQAFHEQGDRNRRMLQQMQPNRGVGQSVASSSSFDLGAPDFPSLPRVVPIHSGNQPQEEGPRNTSGKSHHEGTEISRTAPDPGPWGRQHHRDPGIDDSVRNSPMNPSANVFAPSYDNRAGESFRQSFVNRLKHTST